MKALSLNLDLPLRCLYLVREHSVKLLFGQTEAFAVGAVHHQDDNLKDRDQSVSTAVTGF